jgi:hypothetical protein
MSGSHVATAGNFGDFPQEVAGMERAIPPDVRVLACQALAPELAALGVAPDQMRLLDQGLHRCPQELRQELARNLKELESDAAVKLIVLVYGYCGGGLEGLSPRRADVILPLVHDCIPLLLGRTPPSPPPGAGGIFYLSPGWIEHGRTPYTEFLYTRERFGHDDAMWTTQRMLNSYREVVLIETPAGLSEAHRRHARTMARLFGLAYREEQGDGRLLEDLLAARSNRAGILHLNPGDVLTIECLRRTS